MCGWNQRQIDAYGRVIKPADRLAPRQGEDSYHATAVRAKHLANLSSRAARREALRGAKGSA